jgi:hypothetical protein
MKKLIYLRKWNESVSEDDCDFQTFKEIMYELSDNYHCEFFDYSKDDTFYDCHLILPEIPDVYTSIDSCFGGNLEEIAYYDGPEDFDSVKDRYKDEINQNINNLRDLEENINKGIRYNESMMNIINIIENDIIERLKTFKNFDALSVGIGYMNNHNVLRICFDIKDEVGDYDDKSGDYDDETF